MYPLTKALETRQTKQPLNSYLNQNQTNVSPNFNFAIIDTDLTEGLN